MNFSGGARRRESQEPALFLGEVQLLLDQPPLRGVVGGVRFLFIRRIKLSWWISENFRLMHETNPVRWGDHFLIIV